MASPNPLDPRKFRAKYGHALVCGHADGYFGTVTDCWPGECRILLWLSCGCAKECVTANCGAPHCRRTQHTFIKLELRVAANCPLNCWHEFIPKRLLAKPEPLPKPKVQPATSAALHEIWNMDFKADAYDRYLLECRETDTAPMPYGKWIKVLAWKWRRV